jgi:rRNA 2'-O-methyltransferase fibrillarin
VCARVVCAQVMCLRSRARAQPGSKVLYLGAASGTTVSHVSDIVGAVSACVGVLL